MERLKSGFVLSGRYRLSHKIASGGMGQVWEATDLVLDRRVAVKLLHPHTRDEKVSAARFRDEARFGAALHHPNIVAVHDFGEDEGLAYLVMELVDGPTVAQRLRADGAFAPDEVRTVVAQVASGLVAAHGIGVIHRDVKPANIILGTVAKLMDFGIARADEGGQYTGDGEVLGTPEYLSPEQAMGHPLTARSDVYSLGAVAHEMLTGVKPFARGTHVETALAHVNDSVPPLPEAVPDDLRAMILACLAKDPAQRPSAADLIGLAPESYRVATKPAPPPVPAPPVPAAAVPQPVVPTTVPRMTAVEEPPEAPSREPAPGVGTRLEEPPDEQPVTLRSRQDYLPAWARNGRLLGAAIVLLMALMLIVLWMA